MLIKQVHDQILGGTSARGRRCHGPPASPRRLVRPVACCAGTCRGFPFQSCSRRQRRCSSLCFARVQRHYSKARRTGVRTRRWRAGWRHDSATSYSYRSPSDRTRRRPRRWWSMARRPRGLVPSADGRRPGIWSCDAWGTPVMVARAVQGVHRFHAMRVCDPSRACRRGGAGVRLFEVDWRRGRARALFQRGGDSCGMVGTVGACARQPRCCFEAE